MARGLLIAILTLVGALAIAGAVLLKPNSYQSCVRMITSDIDRKAALEGATIHPRDMEAQAARTCAGVPA